jgi:hypothetical protein
VDVLLGRGRPVDDALGDRQVERDRRERGREPGEQRDPQPLGRSQRRAGPSGRRERDA